MNGQNFITSANGNSLTYTITSTGVYYIRVDLGTSSIRKFVPFKIVIKVNGVQKLSQDDYISKRTNALSFSKFTTNNACQAKLTYTGPAFTKIEIYSPDQLNTGTTSLYSTSASVYSFAVTMPGTWGVAVYTSMGSTTTLSPYTIVFTTSCPNQCINTNLPTNLCSVCGNYIYQNGEQCDNGNKTGCINCIIDEGY